MSLADDNDSYLRRGGRCCMIRISLEYLELDSSECSVPANVFLRQEPEDEEEDEDEDDEEHRDSGDEEDDGYSE